MSATWELVFSGEKQVMMEEHYESLVNTIESIYDLRGICVTAVYVRDDLMEWIRKQGSPRFSWERSVVFEERGNVAFHKTKNKTERVTMQPYGARKPIPVKGKYSGSTPWKVVCTLDEED